MNNLLRSYFSKISTHKVARSSMLVFAGSMVANFSGYLYHLVVGRILGPEEYSVLAAFLSIFVIFNSASLVVQNILTKFFSIFKAKGELGQAKRLFLLSVKRLGLLMIAAIAILIVLTPVLSEFLHIPEKIYFVWFYILFALFFFSTINTSVFQGFQKFKIMVIFLNLNMGLRLVLGAFFAFFGVGWAIFANALSNLMIYLASLYPLRFILSQKEKEITISKKFAVSYSIPTLLATLGINALYSLDVILVKHFFSQYQAGIYSAISVLGRVIFFATSTFVIVLFPIVAERKELGQGFKKVTAIALLFVLGASSAITLFYAVFPDFVTRILYGPSYMQAADNIVLFAVFMIFFSCSSLLVNVSLAAGKTFVFLFSLIASMSQIVLISLYHTSLAQVIQINTIIGLSLFIVLTIFFFYDFKKA